MASPPASVPLSALLTALNLSSEGIVLFEPVFARDGALCDMRIELINDAAVRIFGIPREMATGQLLSQIWKAEEGDPGMENIARVLDSREEIHYEWFTDNLGDRRWFDIILRPFGDLSIAALYHEVTEQKRYLAELEQQKAFYEELIHQSPNRISILQPIFNAEGQLEDFLCDYANYGPGIDDVHRNLSVYKSSLIGQKLSVALPSIKTSSVWEICQRVARTGLTASTEIHYTDDGKNTLATLAAQRLKDGRIYVSTIDISDTRKMAHALEREREQLDTLLREVPLGITVFESVRNEQDELTDLRLVRRNDRVLQLTRIPAEVYRPGALLSELMPKELTENFEPMLNVVRTGEPMMHELYQPHLDLWISSRVMKHGDGVLSTIQDVTAQKRHGEEIEQGARLLHAVLDSSPVAVVVYRSVRNEFNAISDFQPIIVNRLALDISKRSSEEFLRDTLFQRDPKAVSLLDQLTAVVENEQPEVFEHRVGQTDKWVRSITTPFGDGFIATSQDITEQNRQSAQIAEQAELFNSVLGSLQNGLVIYRIINNDAGELADLEVLETSGSVERDTQRSRDQLIGKRVRSLYPGIEKTEYWKEHARVAATGEPASFETHFRLGGIDNYLFNSVSLIGKDKIVTVYYIINDLKEAQRRLEHSVLELQRSNADLEQFASIASHDLQEPLRKVQSFGNMLESRYGELLGDHGRDLLGRMQSAAARMRNLVTGLLAFARLSGDEQEPLAPVDLHGLITELITDLDQNTDAVRGTIHIPERLPFVLGLESQLRHLFHNLLTNALKFHKEGVGPVVTISFGELRQEDPARLSPIANKKEFLRIEVHDNGIGFDKQYAERIFGLFERLHGMSEYRGTGLGLSICRRVAERHNGAIWAESQPGEGANFIVLLKKAP